MGRRPTNAISIYSLISDHDDKTVEGQREKIDHTCIDRRLHWSNDRYDSISS